VGGEFSQEWKIPPEAVYSVTDSVSRLCSQSGLAQITVLDCANTTCFGAVRFHNIVSVTPNINFRALYLSNICKEMQKCGIPI